MMQMVVEYLLYVQNALHSRNIELEAQSGGASAQVATMQAQLVEQALYSGVLESRLSGRPVAPGLSGTVGPGGVPFPPMMPSGGILPPGYDPYFATPSSGTMPPVDADGPAQCALCYKLFQTGSFLAAHMQRRHPRVAAHAPHLDVSAAGAPATGACPPADAAWADSVTTDTGVDQQSADQQRLVDAIARELTDAMAPLMPPGAPTEPYFLGGPVEVSDPQAAREFMTRASWADGMPGYEAQGGDWHASSTGIPEGGAAYGPPWPEHAAAGEGDLPPGHTAFPADATTGGVEGHEAVSRAIAEAREVAAAEARANLAELSSQLEAEMRSRAAEAAAAGEAAAGVEAKMQNLVREMEMKMKEQSAMLRRSLEEETAARVAEAAAAAAEEAAATRRVHEEASRVAQEETRKAHEAAAAAAREAQQAVAEMRAAVQESRRAALLAEAGGGAAAKRGGGLLGDVILDDGEEETGQAGGVVMGGEGEARPGGAAAGAGSAAGGRVAEEATWRAELSRQAAAATEREVERERAHAERDAAHQAAIEALRAEMARLLPAGGAATIVGAATTAGAATVGGAGGLGGAATAGGADTYGGAASASIASPAEGASHSPHPTTEELRTTESLVRPGAAQSRSQHAASPRGGEPATDGPSAVSVVKAISRGVSWASDGDNSPAPARGGQVKPISRGVSWASDMESGSACGSFSAASPLVLGARAAAAATPPSEARHGTGGKANGKGNGLERRDSGVAGAAGGGSKSKPGEIERGSSARSMAAPACESPRSVATCGAEARRDAAGADAAYASEARTNEVTGAALSVAPQPAAELVPPPLLASPAPPPLLASGSGLSGSGSGLRGSGSGMRAAEKARAMVTPEAEEIPMPIHPGACSRGDSGTCTGSLAAAAAPGISATSHSDPCAQTAVETGLGESATAAGGVVPAAAGSSAARRAARELSRSDRYSDDPRTHVPGEPLPSNCGYTFSRAEWDEERRETEVQLQQELEEWEVTPDTPLTASALERLVDAKRRDSVQQAAFPVTECTEERRRVEQRLDMLVQANRTGAASSARPAGAALLSQARQRSARPPAPDRPQAPSSAPPLQVPTAPRGSTVAPVTVAPVATQHMPQQVSTEPPLEPPPLPPSEAPKEALRSRAAPADTSPPAPPPPMPMRAARQGSNDGPELAEGAKSSQPFSPLRVIEAPAAAPARVAQSSPAPVFPSSQAPRHAHAPRGGSPQIERLMSSSSSDDGDPLISAAAMRAPTGTVGAGTVDQKRAGPSSTLGSPDASAGARSNALAAFAMQGSAMSKRTSFNDGVRAFSADEFSD